MKDKELESDRFNILYEKIKIVVDTARDTVYKTANFETVKANWIVGKYIVEEEQNGKEKAKYGNAIIKNLSKKLTEEYGKGFTKDNLWFMRKFYLSFEKVDALRRELSWTHYRTLLRVENTQAREFYIDETIACNWNTRYLERAINTSLYERLLISQDKKLVLDEVKKLETYNKPEDYIKDPYVLDFLGLEENKAFLESDLEEAIINNLQRFLLELGKGFSFVGRQRRFSVDGVHYYVDLVFFNYYLNCFFLIELKSKPMTPRDVGQLDFYVKYYDLEEKTESMNPTIGLLLCTDKSNLMAKYTALESNKQIFASKYKLYLPTEEELKNKLELISDTRNEEK